MRIIPRSNLWFAISGITFLLSLAAFFIFGFNLGLDFTGGTLMEFKFQNTVAKADLEKSFTDMVAQIKTDALKPPNNATEKATTLQAEEATLDLGTPAILPSEDSLIVRTKHIDETTHEEILQNLKKQFGNFEETRFTTIGPTIGASLQKKAFFALVLASLMIVFYIAFAFRKVPKRVSSWRFGLSAIIALLHDTVITIGFYVVIGKFLGAEMNGLFVTAILTVMGFSVHDTIVIFDRIRENLKHQTRDESFGDVAEKSVNQTLARSINTSLTVLITLTALVVFGSESIFHFTLTLLFGIAVGTYSSIFVAAPFLNAWQKWKPIVG